MPTYYEIPTSASPQTFSIQLVGVTYNLRLTYHEANAEHAGAIVAIDTDSDSLVDLNVMSSWILDIFDTTDNPLVLGIPLIPGIDLLYQYQYLKIGGSLVVSTDGDPDRTPEFNDLGTSSHLWFVTFP